MKKYDVAIIGGGFSGLCLACMLAKNNRNNIVVLEGNSKIGKKILATGNGQGNITNNDLDFCHYHGDINFFKYALSNYNNEYIKNFFYNLGLITVSDNKKVYPANYCASSILDVLRFYLEKKQIEIKTDFYVDKIQKDKFFKVFKGNEVVNCENLVVAFGGSSGQGFLTDGKSYNLLKPFGHLTTKLYPSLVQLVCEKDKLKGLKGIKTGVKLTLKSDNKILKQTCGDLIFTDYGVSGNSVFEISSYLRGNANCSLNIEFLPAFDEQTLLNLLKNKCKSDTTYEKLLISVVHGRIGLRILNYLNISPEDRVKSENIILIVKALKKYTIKVIRQASFEYSQVTAGGFDTKFVNGSTMQSKLCENLYIIGEALDVDGDCGGYNLQWAFSSACVCMESLNAKI